MIPVGSLVATLKPSNRACPPTTPNGAKPPLHFSWFPCCDAGPFQFSTLRFALGALCMVAVILRYREPLLPGRGQWPPVFILGFVLALNLGLTMSALELGGTGKTAVLVYTMPFWVLIFARLALQERLTRWQVIAVSIALGLLVLIEPWTLSGGIVPSLLALGAGTSWGASVVYVKDLQKKSRRCRPALADGRIPRTRSWSRLNEQDSPCGGQAPTAKRGSSR